MRVTPHSLSRSTRKSPTVIVILILAFHRFLGAFATRHAPAGVWVWTIGRTAKFRQICSGERFLRPRGVTFRRTFCQPLDEFF